MAIQLTQQTLAEFAIRFWRRMERAQREGDRYARHRLAWWLIERITAGDITDAQARNSYNNFFGASLTAGQWSTLKTNKLIPMHDRYAALIAEGAL